MSLGTTIMIERAILRKLQDAAEQDLRQENLARILQYQFSILVREGLQDIPIAPDSPDTATKSQSSAASEDILATNLDSPHPSPSQH